MSYVDGFSLATIETLSYVQTKADNVVRFWKVCLAKKSNFRRKKAHFFNFLTISRMGFIYRESDILSFIENLLIDIFSIIITKQVVDGSTIEIHSTLSSRGVLRDN